MGHYSEYYDADREESERKSKSRYTQIVEDEMKKMSSDDLNLLAKISQNIDSFQTVFSLISAHRK